MSYEELLTFQGYAKFFLILVVFIIFYSYVYSMYKRQKTGKRDFEKYSNLVHDDSIDSTPLEPNQGSKKDKENVV